MSEPTAPNSVAAIEALRARGLRPDRSEVFVSAARNDDRELVALFLAAGHPPDGVSASGAGLTALYHCAQHRRHELARLLLEAGANGLHLPDGGIPPLYALLSHNLALAEWVLERAEPGPQTRAALQSHRWSVLERIASSWRSHTSAEDRAQLTRLFARALELGVEVDHLHYGAPISADLVSQQALPLLQLALAHGADPNAAVEGQSLLFQACLASAHERQDETWAVIEALVSAGARLDTRTPAGFGLAQIAARQGLLPLLERLRDAGAPMTPAGRSLDLLGCAWEGGHPEVEDWLRGDAEPRSKAEGQLHAALEAKDEETALQMLELGARPDCLGTAHSPLVRAIEQTMWRLYDALLAAGADPTLQDARGRTPLQLMSAAFERHRLMDLLDRLAGSKSLTSADARGALVAAIKAEDRLAIELLMAEQIPLESPDEDGCTPLAMAARQGDEQTVGLLLRAGAALEPATGHSPLAEAAQNRHIGCCIQLIEAGADVYAPGPRTLGSLVLHDLFRLLSRSQPLRDLLLSRRVDPTRCDARGESALNNLSSPDRKLFEPLILASDSGPGLALAAKLGDLQRVEEILAAGVRPDGPNAYGSSPLQHAANHGHLAVVERLLAAGADADFIGRFGATPLSWACSGGQLSIAQRLVAAGARVQPSRQWESAPLVQAMSSDDPALIEWLVAQGADLEVHTPGMGCALACAIWNKPRSLETFLRLGGRPDPGPDERKRTPLSVARDKGHEEIEALLVAALS